MLLRVLERFFTACPVGGDGVGAANIHIRLLGAAACVTVHGGRVDDTDE